MPLIAGTRFALLGSAASAIAAAPLALDGIASLTGAWSLSRDLVTSFIGGSRYSLSGSDVTTLEDQSGANRDLTDGGFATRRPAETTAGPNSRLCADFDGSSDFLAGAAISNFISNSSGCLVISLMVDAYTLNNALVYQNDAIFCDQSQFMGIYGRNSGGGLIRGFNWDGNQDAPSDHSLATGTVAVIHWRHHGGTVYLGLNGSENSTASGNTSTMTGALVMAGRATQYANMKVFEAFATSDGSQTTAINAAIADMMTHIGA